jgi:hypothetical protein
MVKTWVSGLPINVLRERAKKYTRRLVGRSHCKAGEGCFDFVAFQNAAHSSDEQQSKHLTQSERSEDAWTSMFIGLVSYKAEHGTFPLLTVVQSTSRQTVNHSATVTQPTEPTIYFYEQQSDNEKNDSYQPPKPGNSQCSHDQDLSKLHSCESRWPISRLIEANCHQLPCLTMSNWLMSPEKMTLSCPDLNGGGGGGCATRFLGYPFVHIQQPWGSLLKQ